MFSQCQWHRNVSQQSLLALDEKLALQRGLKYECTLFQRSNRRSTDNGRMKLPGKLTLWRCCYNTFIAFRKLFR